LSLLGEMIYPIPLPPQVFSSAFPTRRAESASPDLPSADTFTLRRCCRCPPAGTFSFTVHVFRCALSRRRSVSGAPVESELSRARETELGRSKDAHVDPTSVRDGCARFVSDVTYHGGPGGGICPAHPSRSLSFAAAVARCAPPLPTPAP